MVKSKKSLGNLLVSAKFALPNNSANHGEMGERVKLHL
jgi:hypothetical protein